MAYSHRNWLLACASLFLGIANPTQGEEPAVKVKELRIQKAGETTYFHLKLAMPNTLSQTLALNAQDWTVPPTALRFRLARVPRLVPVDGKGPTPYFRVPSALHFPDNERTIEFLGRAPAGKTTEFLLLYPTEKNPEPTKSLAPSLERNTWAETRLKLDFRMARNLAPCKTGRDREHAPDANDLEGLWADARADELAVQELIAPDNGYFGQAREAIGRKYNVPAKPLPKALDGRDRSAAFEAARLYETSTGAAALAESLAQHRLLNPTPGRKAEREHHVAALAGIDIAEHPWEKMMGGKKPSIEPPASLIPHDNYYVYFNDIRKLLDFRELTEHWSSLGIAAYELHSRDLDLSKRYERQLCLKSTGLARTLGPAVVRSIAATGSDLYLREGSDVTVIFHVRNAGLFLAAVEPQVEAARKEHGDRLRHQKEKYQGVELESYTTPLREVSLHRATVGEYVIYSNSLVGLRRVLDAHAGRIKRLSDSLDFRYMRTVFRADDKQEDGFVFLSDAFIRQFVGPHSKIKEKRRVEALTSLYMLTHGALFCAAETGHLPRNHHELMRAARLRPEEIEPPDGVVRWDVPREMAVSDVYNTIHFATPLIELPIEKVTDDERDQYKRFRQAYLDNYRQFFDPAGIRLTIRDDNLRAELYLLPAPTNNVYSTLRAVIGEAPTKLFPSRISPNSIIEVRASLSPLAGIVSAHTGIDIRNWLLVRLDDGPVFREWARIAVQGELGESITNLQEEVSFARTPLTFGVGTDPSKERRIAEYFRHPSSYPEEDVTSHRLQPDYKKTRIDELRWGPNSSFAKRVNDAATPKEKMFLPKLHYLTIDQDLYMGFSLPALHEIIDKKSSEMQNGGPKDEGIPINLSVHVNPKAMRESGPALRTYLEWQTLKHSLPNTLLWSTLYDSGVVPRDATSDAAKATARKFFGFVPVSPDGTAYRYDARIAEVVNTRHGSLRSPKLHATIADDSPLAKLLEDVQTIRADLRFREDGIHTVVTIQRKAAK